MQQSLFPKNSLTSTSLSEVRLALLSRLQEEDLDLKTKEGRSFLNTLGFLETKNPNILYSRMLGVYFLMTREELSRKSLKFSPTWGMTVSGNYLIVRTSESHRIGSECTLSDILEEQVDQKYFLSDERATKLLEKSASRK